MLNSDLYSGKSGLWGKGSGLFRNCSRLYSGLFYVVWVLLLSLLLATACQKNPTPVVEGNVSLSAEAGVIEAWLTVTTEQAQGMEIVLTRDGAERLRFPAVPETTVVDTGLLPAHSYIYAARLVKDGQTAARSNSVELTTMDTTSHDFQWEIIEFPSPYGSGALYDVAIINENNIWAVGEIYSDSNQTWLPYNAVHWDGQQWELMRIQFRYFCDREDTFPAPIKSVVAFGPNEVFFTAISQITYWNGQTQEYIECIPVSANELWGTDRNNIYAVGAFGKIAHYDGSVWRRIESGTELPIQDIWGTWNERTGEWEILAVASNKFLNEGKKLLRIEGTRVTAMPDSGLSWSLSSVWFIPDRRYFIAGDGFYPSYTAGPLWRRDTTFPAIYKDAVRGLALNDIVVSGSNGLLSHFNGASWRHYLNNELPFFSGRYLRVAIHKSLIVAVGWINDRAIITMGHR